MKNIQRAGEIEISGWRKIINKLPQYRVETIQACCWLLCKSFHCDQTDCFKKVISCCHRNLIKETKTQIKSNALWSSPKGKPEGKGSLETVEQVGAKLSDFILEFAKSVLTSPPQLFIIAMSPCNLDDSIPCQVLFPYKTKKRLFSNSGVTNVCQLIIIWKATTWTRKWVWFFKKKNYWVIHGNVSTLIRTKMKKNFFFLWRSHLPLHNNHIVLYEH